MMRIRVYCPRISSFNVEQYESSSNVEIPFENFNIDSSSSGVDYYREKGAREKNVLIFWNFWNCVKVKAPLVSHVSAGHESCRRRRCCFKKNVCRRSFRGIDFWQGHRPEKANLCLKAGWLNLLMSQQIFRPWSAEGPFNCSVQLKSRPVFCILKKKNLVPKLVPIDDGCCPNRCV